MRILHTMLRVKSLEKSIEFYTKHLKMELLRKKDYPKGEFTLAFLGYAPEDQSAVLELTYNWDERSYDLGSAYGHIAIAVDNIYEVCEQIKKSGGNVTREPGPMKFSEGGGSHIAFVEDPDGYKIELIEKR